MVNRGVVINLFLEDGKDAGGSPMTGAPLADRGTTNPNAVAINVEQLVRRADDDQNRTGWRNLGLPDVVAVLEDGEGSNVTAIGEVFR